MNVLLRQAGGVGGAGGRHSSKGRSQLRWGQRVPLSRSVPDGSRTSVSCDQGTAWVGASGLGRVSRRAVQRGLQLAPRAAHRPAPQGHRGTRGSDSVGPVGAAAGARSRARAQHHTAQSGAAARETGRGQQRLTGLSPGSAPGSAAFRRCCAQVCGWRGWVPASIAHPGNRPTRPGPRVSRGARSE